MQRFKSAVNTVIANIQDEKSRKEFQKIKKLEISYTDRVLQRMGFDKNKNDIKLLIQRNILPSKFENIYVNILSILNKDTFKDNIVINKLRNTLILLEKFLLKYYNFFIFNKTEYLNEIIIKKAFNDIKDYLEKNNNNKINIHDLHIIIKLLFNFIYAFIYLITLRKDNIELFEKGFSDNKKILKYIIIIVGIYFKLSNYILLSENNNNKIEIHSLSSQSLKTNSIKEDIISFLKYKMPKFLNFNNATNIYKKTINNYKNINKQLDIYNKDNKLYNKLKKTTYLLYNLLLNNISIFHYEINDNIYALTKKALDIVFLPINNLLDEIKDKEITISILKKMRGILSLLNDRLYERGCEYCIGTIYKIKVGDFKKGYKDYKNYLRYIKIIAILDDKIQKFLDTYFSEKNDISSEHHSITSKSSNRSYKSNFKKDEIINPTNEFDDLIAEPLSAIKSSPRYSTYFAEK